MRDKPVHHFFQILKFVAQFFRADSDFIILALKESRISSFFKFHTLFLRKYFVFLLVDELCFKAALHRSPWLRREKILHKAPEFPEIMKLFFFMSKTI